MLESSIEHITKTLFHALKAHESRLVTAESCTGGLLASYITSIAGASNIFERGFITYADSAKQELLKLNERTLTEHGAVSAETAAEMARGALDNSHSDIAMAITGIAGPDGGTDEKPVGLVYFGLCSHATGTITEEHDFEGERKTIRLQSVLAALKILMRHLEPGYA